MGVPLFLTICATSRKWSFVGDETMGDVTALGIKVSETLAALDRARQLALDRPHDRAASLNLRSLSKRYLSQRAKFVKER